MPNVINLRLTRKTRARTGAEKRAEENRIKFGQTKAEKKARKAEEMRAGKAHASGLIEAPDKDDKS